LFSNRQIEILKSLKGKELSLDELSALLDISIDALYELMGGEFDKLTKVANYDPYKITVSEEGSAFLAKIHQDKIRFWLPTIISMLALISSVIGWFFPRSFLP